MNGKKSGSFLYLLLLSMFMQCDSLWLVSRMLLVQLLALLVPPTAPAVVFLDLCVKIVLQVQLTANLHLVYISFMELVQH
jgi:hypothetical protein